jgi:hypothetical protein
MIQLTPEVHIHVCQTKHDGHSRDDISIMKSKMIIRSHMSPINDGLLQVDCAQSNQHHKWFHSCIGLVHTWHPRKTMGTVMSIRL